MKKYIYIITFLFSISSFGQQIFWYDVILNIKPTNQKNVENLVDEYYSSFDFPENTSLDFSNIPLKGESFTGTHILSFAAESASSLAELRQSLSGDQWDLYIAEIQKYIVDARSSAGKSLITYNNNIRNFPIGQAWVFSVDDTNSFADAFSKVMKTYKPDGFVGMGQIVHGTSNGENTYIYGTYKDLSSAFDFGPKNDEETKAFDLFFKETAKEYFSQSFTRVLIKKYE